MTNIDLMDYWIESSDRDYESMKKNYETKQYTWALFIGHLTLEKLLKAIYAKLNEDSDIDVAIIINSDSNVFDLMVELMMLTQNIDLRIEPHPIKVKDFEDGNPFVQEIIETGIKVA